MRSKKSNQKYHAKRRFGERLGVRLSQFLRDTLLNMIHNNRTKVVQRQSNRVSIHEVTFTPRPQDMLGALDAKPLTVHIVYDRERKNIVTVAEPGTPFDHLLQEA